MGGGTEEGFKITGFYDPVKIGNETSLVGSDHQNDWFLGLGKAPFNIFQRPS